MNLAARTYLSSFIFQHHAFALKVASHDSRPPIRRMAKEQYISILRKEDGEVVISPCITKEKLGGAAVENGWL